MEDDEKDMVRLNALDVMRGAMKSAKRFITSVKIPKRGSPGDGYVALHSHGSSI